MTPKERFLASLTFNPVDRVPCMEICLWQQTRDRWLAEGMPATVNTAFMHRGDRYFGLDGYETAAFDAVSPVPPVPSEVLAEDEETVLFRDGFGRTRRAYKPGTAGGTRLSMDTYLDFAVKDQTSWEAFKPRYQGPVAERYPADWEAVKQMALTTDLPLTLLNPLGGTFGYYSMLRNWMGTEGLSYLLYDDRALVEGCLEFLTEFALRVMAPAVEQIEFDFYYIHEDMSYKNGPLISPALFRRLFLPHYRRFVDFLRQHGVKVILVDTDGNCEVLLPLFIEAGVDGFGPVERAAGMDPLAVRRRFGRDICMVGGVDKRELAKGRAEIEAEVTRLAPLVEDGGFIPTIDHAVPPDVSLANFSWYLEVKRSILGR
ncbi:MAG: uroporphyrinogen decarboxylase family protein [Candidatus Latescibacterota bacterium]|jgi:uroporphyrinogen decarboxylase